MYLWFLWAYLTCLEVVWTSNWEIPRPSYLWVVHSPGIYFNPVLFFWVESSHLWHFPSYPVFCFLTLLCCPLFSPFTTPFPFCCHLYRCLFLVYQSACVPGWLIALEMRNRGTNFAHRSVPWRSLLPTASLNQVGLWSPQMRSLRERDGAHIDLLRTPGLLTHNHYLPSGLVVE